jgi:hypothetical protein
MCINMQLYLNKRNKKRERENKNKPALSQSPQQAQLVPTTHLPLAHLLAAAQRPQTLAAWVSQPSRHPACRRASRGARPRCSSSRRNNRAHVVQIPGKNGFPSLPCSSQRFSLARRRAGRNRVAGLELARSSTAPVEVNPPSPSLPRPPFFFRRGPRLAHGGQHDQRGPWLTHGGPACPSLGAASPWSWPPPRGALRAVVA